ncbi:hypothetical protein F7Q99_31530 [Streptomyces kaniharaensis]|uniref:Uncharacterized protein n=1 Tax=Streptomyces kaniharaensis TaxID=212423 RepID=A0A6N7L182_9ACTN|nr:hypothetical protein [Streptomyces kaniharaensis]MQS16599.1 hypothetical protein [Streptomyces kaniharaensis]
MDESMHGAALIDRVIARVKQDGWPTADAPDITEPVPLAPETIDRLRLAGDRPLPPSLRRWLAFDSSWLSEIGWYDDEQAPVFEGRALGDTTEWMYGSDGVMVGMFADFEKLLPSPCLPLVGGSDSRRLLYLGRPDSTGEYPVLVTDIDDLPYVAVMYPGLDVYLADLADVIDLDFDTYTGLMSHPEYGSRMREHAENTELGPDGLEFQDLDWNEGA